MNERELSMIKVLGEEVAQVLNEISEGFNKSLQQQREEFEKKVEKLSMQFNEIKDAPSPDFTQMLEDALAVLPHPEAPVMPDFEALLTAAAEKIPLPKDGKSITPEDVRSMLQDMVDKAFANYPPPKNGKDYDPDVLNLAVETAVSAAVSALPIPEPAIDGRDALAIEVLPVIDEEKSYPRGSYATHNGGLWRAYEKTHGMRGWECVVDGVASVDVNLAEARCVSITVNRASGESDIKSFDIPVMIYQGVFKSGQQYQQGDTVTWGGSLWHCDYQTGDKPGEPTSKGWTLAAKRGRDLRD